MVLIRKTMLICIIMKISHEKIVVFNYILKDKNNNVVESTIGSDPVIYLHGSGKVLPIIEEALENKEVEDEVKVTVEPKDGYGPVIDDLIQTADIDEFKDLEKIEKGELFQLELDTDEGAQTAVAKIIEVKGNEVKFDMNHPLAGQTITFEITVEEVREATPEELDSELSIESE